MKHQPSFIENQKFHKEIFNLRVKVWEDSCFNSIVNKKLFPKGWSDELDIDGKQLVVFDKSKRIVAAARINVFDSVEQLPFFTSIHHLNLPKTRPFVYYSRLVVDAHHQGNGVSKSIDDFVINYCKLNDIQWIIGLSNKRTEVMVKRSEFKIFGDTTIKYHENSKEHKVDVIIKTLNFNSNQPS